MVTAASGGAVVGDQLPKAVGPTKVIIRNLPPTITEQQFLECVSPLGEHDWFRFVPADLTLGRQAYSYAFINFLREEDVLQFHNSFDGYVFVDSRGNEYTSVVEFATFQRVPSRQPKVDAKYKNTFEQDDEYLQFCRQFSERTSEKALSKRNVELSLDDLDSHREKKSTPTPLTEYLNSGAAANANAKKNEDRRAKRDPIPKAKSKVERSEVVAPSSSSSSSKKAEGGGRHEVVAIRRKENEVQPHKAESGAKRAETAVKGDRKVDRKPENESRDHVEPLQRDAHKRGTRDAVDQRDRAAPKRNVEEKVPARKLDVFPAAISKKPEASETPKPSSNELQNEDSRKQRGSEAIRLRSTRTPVTNSAPKSERHDDAASAPQASSTKKQPRSDPAPAAEAAAKPKQTDRRRPEQRYYDPRAAAHSQAGASSSQRDDYYYEEQQPARASGGYRRAPPARREGYDYDNYDYDYDSYYEEYGTGAGASRGAATYSSRSARGGKYAYDSHYDERPRAAQSGSYNSGPPHSSRAYSARSSQSRPYK